MGAKDRIVAASGDGTVRSILFDIVRRNVWPAPYSGRVLAYGFSERWRGREVELLQKKAEGAARYDAARAAGDPACRNLRIEALGTIKTRGSQRAVTYDSRRRDCVVPHLAAAVSVGGKLEPR
jgi:hypothetical protein